MEFVPLVVLAAAVNKLVDFVQYARARDFEGILVQLIAWAGGVAAMMLAAHTAWAAGIAIGGHSLGGLNLAGQILAGIALGSAASLAHDYKPQPAVGAHRKG